MSSVRGPPSALISALIRRRPEYCLATGRIYSYTTAPRGLSSFEAGTRPMGVGTRSQGSAGPEAGGGVCAWIEASIRAALSIDQRDIFLVCLDFLVPKLCFASSGGCQSQDF